MSDEIGPRLRRDVNAAARAAERREWTPIQWRAFNVGRALGGTVVVALIAVIMIPVGLGYVALVRWLWHAAAGM